MSVFIGYPSFMAYQMMKGKKGNNDGFPSVTGMIARYSASGLTNEHMKENPVWVDKTGNGHDLQMKNFIWGGMSGVGGYVDNWNSSADWNIDSYWVNSHTDHKLQFITAGVVAQARSNNIYNAENVYKNILNVNGLTEAVNKGSVKALRIIATDPITSKAIKTFSFETDGVIQISFDDVLQDYYVAYFLSGNNTNDIDITIEQIPEYEGYLVTDGVDDKIVSSSFGMGKDFTIVGDWKFIDNKKSGTGLVKGSSFYIYNTMIGLDLYINSGSVKNSLDGIKSINAACSDGRAYDRNWNEILANTGNVVGSGGMLEVSSSGGRFDRIAFKNLAIYPRILSKDDCIKAYNYLQTLKAK